MDLGFEKAGGYECLSLNEIEPVICDTIKKNLKRAFPKSSPKVYDCDIRELTAGSLCKELRIAPGELFAIIGGPLHARRFRPPEGG